MWWWAQTSSHQGPSPYDTTVRVVLVYSRGERGEDVDGWALVVARPVRSPTHHANPDLMLKEIGPCGRPSRSIINSPFSLVKRY